MRPTEGATEATRGEVTPTERPTQVCVPLSGSALIRKTPRRVCRAGVFPGALGLYLSPGLKHPGTKGRQKPLPSSRRGSAFTGGRPQDLLPVACLGAASKSDPWTIQAEPLRERGTPACSEAPVRDRLAHAVASPKPAFGYYHTIPLLGRRSIPSLPEYSMSARRENSPGLGDGV